MKILLTGFEPFGGSPINPSEQAARALDGQTVAAAAAEAEAEAKTAATPKAKARVVTAILPVDWQKGPEALSAALRHHHPDAVLCLGEAPSRAMLSIERVAINLMDFRIPDNSGATLTDRPIIPGGPAAYFVTLPARAMLDAVQTAGVPVELSLSAGAYLCNQTLYHLLHTISEQNLRIPAGFIHLPRLPQQVVAANQPAPSMSLDTTLTGLNAALSAIVRHC